MTSATSRLPLTFGTPAIFDSFEQSLAVAYAAETAGFTSLAVADHLHDAYLDAWTLATAIGMATQKIRLFHTTLNVPYRLPSLLAKEAATLDLLTGGRLDLCLGAGGEANRPVYQQVGVTLASPADRLTDLEDAIHIMRGMWTNERFSYTGRHFYVDDILGLPKPAQAPLPVWIGAGLPRSLRMAGRLADGFVRNGGWTSVEEMARQNGEVDKAAKRAGRDPRSIRRILNGGGFVGTAQEVEAYRNRPPSPLFQPGGLVGTPAEVLALVRAYRNQAGVDLFNVRFQPADALDQIRRFGETVIPEALTP